MYRLSIAIALNSFLCGCCPVPTFIMPKQPPPVDIGKIGTGFSGGQGWVEDYPPIRVFIPPDSYNYSMQVTIWRYPNDDKHQEPGYYTNIYRMGDKIANRKKMFQIFWKVTVPEEEPDTGDGMLCPKVSWTMRQPSVGFCSGMDKADKLYKEFCPPFKDEYPYVPWKQYYYKKASCYSITGLDRDALLPCWKDRDGTWLYLPDNIDGRGPERMGCKVISPSKIKPGTIVEFEFLTDRLGNFRLLPASDEERARVRDWRKPGSTFVTPEGICEVVPESSRWAYRFGEDGTVFGRMICRDDGDCREGQLCEQLDGCQPGLGLCKEKTLPAD